ncbi:gp53-like domain-containing protein [Arsenophonus nasoniae]|uniref:Uncharacterized protein n=1 Tax=Arsenophonus nasoniae TaxID=638 RepID=A0AA95GPP7_9GAMM|nr:hypothetical protein [Arsenophonus nasoniae]WGM02682.1 hypothetical protein QE210_06285 [Arsenophonus nasoniae]
MTVVTEVSANQYIGDCATTEFDYEFKIFNEHHLVVIMTDGNGDHAQRLTLNKDYTVTGVNCDEGGKIILSSPLFNGNHLLIERHLPAKQEIAFEKCKQFHAKQHENAFDYLTMLVQQVLGNASLLLQQPSRLGNYFDAKNYRISNISQPKNDNDAVNLAVMQSAIRDLDIRSIRVNDIDIATLPDAESRKNKQLGFDNDGQPTLFDLNELGVFDYILVDSFEKGFEITSRYHALHYEKENRYYRWAGKLPKQVFENSTPELTGGIKADAWIQTTVNSYTKKEIDNQFVKIKDSRAVQFSTLDLVRTDNYAGMSMKNNVQHVALYVSGNSAYTVVARNSDNTIKYAISFPTHSSTLATTNTLDYITAYGFNAIHPSSDTVIKLGTDKGDYDLVCARNNHKFFIRNNNTNQIIYLPEKQGTFAVQEDNYNRQQIDAKLVATHWSAKKAVNGWMKEPYTGIIIQWGRVPRKNTSRNFFPIAFPNTLASMGVANFNSNSNLTELYSPNIQDANNSGFTMRQTKVTNGSNASPLVDMRWIAIGW